MRKIFYFNILDMKSQRIKNKRYSRKVVRSSRSRVGIGGGLEFKNGSFAPTPAPMNAPPPAVHTTPYSSLQAYFKKPVVETYENMARRQLTARREPEPKLPTNINATGRFTVSENTQKWLNSQESEEEQTGKPSLEEQIAARAPYFQKLGENINKELQKPSQSSLANVFSKFNPFGKTGNKMPLTSTPVDQPVPRKGGRRRTKRNKRKMRGTRSS